MEAKVQDNGGENSISMELLEEKMENFLSQMREKEKMVYRFLSMEAQDSPVGIGEASLLKIIESENFVKDSRSGEVRNLGGYFLVLN